MKKWLGIILILTALMIFSHQVKASIGRDTSNSGIVSATSITLPLTIVGTDRLLVAGLHQDPGGSNWAAAWNGNDMGSYDVRQSTSNNQLIWILIAPTTGSHNLVITWTTSRPSTGFGASYTGVFQTETPDATSTKTSIASTDYSQSITTVANNAWAVWLLRTDSGTNSVTPGAGTTLVTEEVAYGTFIFDNSNTAISPAGSYTMSGTGQNVPYRGVMVSFAPVSVEVRRLFLIE